MDKKEFYCKCIKILKEELVPALGCTEPIAIAYAGAKAREVLGEMPDEIIIECSRNIIKNVKGVIVPNTKNLKGIEVSVLAGVIAGDTKKNLEVISGVADKDIQIIKELIKKKICKVKKSDNEVALYIKVILYKEDKNAIVEMMHEHTNITLIQTNDKILFEGNRDKDNFNSSLTDRSDLTLSKIFDFIENININEVKSLLDKQIEYNTAISEEGLKNNYGACVGKTLIETYGKDDVRIRAKALAAAGSDARMSGCSLPVVINSGSGNQGITLSLPIIEYAKELNVSQEKLYRALLLSNMIAIHEKTEIGRLSAYCGAISAACGAGAGITYLHNGNFNNISKTITNIFGNIAGIICDGAKPACAAKIASCIDACILAHEMSMKNRTFKSGEGIIKDNIEKNIDSIAKLARDGMKFTDDKILEIMLEN
ncbi:serine dehydratase subunit alpha family protein [Pseudomonadota bacterium]